MTTTTDRVLVTGGRNNYNWLPLWLALDSLQPRVLIEGGCTGYDEGAFRWAEYHKVILKTVPAPWKMLGMGSGPLRNLYMLEQHKPDLVIVGKGDVGSFHCMKSAIARGIPILDLTKY